MKDDLVFLKPNVVIEPLVFRWYAWTHLISPATAALNITGRHLKIIDSYIQAPQIHAAAVTNPKLRGGPFMDLGGKHVDEIRKFRLLTADRQNKSLVLSDAIKELEELLRTHTKGYSLESLYEGVPDALKGYIELVYDLNNNPSFRFFESLLYRSEYYDDAFQSIALWITHNDERPFCLSTPRLDTTDVLHRPISFSSSAIDELSRMRRTGKKYAYIKELLEIKDKDDDLFQTFFTTETPRQYQKYNGDKIRMRYFGHACILIETKDISILVDPLISYYGYQSAVSHFSDADLPDEIDYVLITHNHQDHVLLETLLPMRHRIGKIIIPRTTSGALQDPSLKLMFDHIGFANVVEIDEMESISFSDCTVTGIPFTGEHCDLNIHAKICYHVKFGRFTLLFVADSRIIESRLYEHIHKQIGDVDVIFLGMECDGAPLTWLYGPLLPEIISRNNDSSRRLSGSDCQKGMALINIFHPKEAYVYAMGQEPWVEFISSVKYTDESNPIVQSNMLIKECRNKGIIAERLYGEKEILYDRNSQELLYSK